MLLPVLRPAVGPHRPPATNWLLPGLALAQALVLLLMGETELQEARELVLEAWRLTAPKKLVRAYDEAHPVA